MDHVERNTKLNENEPGKCWKNILPQFNRGCDGVSNTWLRCLFPANILDSTHTQTPTLLINSSLGSCYWAWTKSFLVRVRNQILILNECLFHFWFWLSPKRPAYWSACSMSGLRMQGVSMFTSKCKVWARLSMHLVLLQSTKLEVKVINCCKRVAVVKLEKPLFKLQLKTFILTQYDIF